jgi:hypothetical protein
MRINCLIRLLIVGLAGAAPGRPLPAETPPAATLRRIGQPLRALVPDLAGPDEALEVDPSLSELKATTVLADAPRDDARRLLARVFGAEWVRKPGGSGAAGAWRLQRRKDVATWVKEWVAARATAEKAVRKVQEDAVRQHLEQSFQALDNPKLGADGRPILPAGVGAPALARVVKGLSRSQLDTIIKHLAANSAVRSGGEPEVAAPPLVIP